MERISKYVLLKNRWFGLEEVFLPLFVHTENIHPVFHRQGRQVNFCLFVWYSKIYQIPLSLILISDLWDHKKSKNLICYLIKQINAVNLMSNQIVSGAVPWRLQSDPVGLEQPSAAGLPEASQMIFSSKVYLKLPHTTLISVQIN